MADDDDLKVDHVTVHQASGDSLDESDHEDTDLRPERVAGGGGLTALDIGMPGPYGGGGGGASFGTDYDRDLYNSGHAPPERYLQDPVFQDNEPNLLDQYYAAVQSTLMRVFGNITLRCAEHPQLVIAVAILFVALIAFLGGRRVVWTNGQDSFLPTSMLQHSQFPRILQSGFMPPEHLSFLVITNTPVRQSVLDVDSIRQVFAAQNATFGFQVPGATANEVTLTFPDHVCIKDGAGKCSGTCVTHLFGDLATAASLQDNAARLEFVQAQARRQFSGQLPLGVYASLRVGDDGTVYDANGWLCTFYTKLDDKASIWLDGWEDFMRTGFTAPGMRLFVQTWHSRAHANVGSRVSDVWLILLAFVLVVITVCVTVCGRSNTGSLPIMIVLGVIATPILAIALGAGLYTMISPTLDLAIVILPAFIFGISFNDEFLLLRRIEDMPPGLRKAPALFVSRAMKREIPAIFVSAITAAAGGWIGWSVDMPAVQSWSAVSSLCLFADFILQCTFLPACVAVQYTWDKQGCCDCCAVDRCCWVRKPAPGRPARTKPPLSTRLSAALAAHLASLPVRCIAAFLVALTLTLGIVGLLNIQVGTNADANIPKSAPFLQTLAQEGRSYPTTLSYNALVLFGDHSGHIRTLMDTISGLQADPGVVALRSWLPAFLRWSNSTTSTSWTPSALNLAVSQFVHSPAGVPFARDIIFQRGSNVPIMVGSRTQVLVPLAAGRGLIYDRLDDIVDSSGLDIGFGSYAQLYALGDLTLPDKLLQSLGWALIIILLFLALTMRLEAAMFVVVLCLVIDISLAAVIWLGSIQLNVLSTLVLVVLIGYGVDFAVHLVHAFVEYPLGSRPTRLRLAFMDNTPAAITGTIASLCVGVPLAFCSTTLYHHIGLLLVWIVIISFVHTTITLPAILSRVGPEPHASEDYSPKRGGLRHWQ